MLQGVNKLLNAGEDPTGAMLLCHFNNFSAGVRFSFQSKISNENAYLKC